MLQENYLSSFYIHTEKKISSYTLPTSQNDDKQIAWNTFDKTIANVKMEGIKNLQIDLLIEEAIKIR